MKLVIAGQFMEVYINDMDKPVIFAELKQKSVKGNIAIQNAINESYFANVSITPGNVAFKGKAKPKANVAQGTISQWQVSNAFSEKLLASSDNLKALGVKTIYKSFMAEPTGTLNLSSTADLTEQSNCVLAKIVIESDREQTKKVQFGFSDRVKVFVNERAVFSAEDNFSSRDYRFLGTMGYFDAIFVPLKKGKNEIVFAVSETFGGWGIKAKLEDQTGIRFLY